MKKLALIVLAALAASACATLSSTYKQGTQAEMARLYDEAIAQYEKAVLENPKESVYRLALERAKLSASLSHLREARRLADAGKRSEAQAEYAKALSYNPRNTQIALEARTRTAEPAPKAEPVSEKIEYPIKLKARDEAVQAHVPTESSLRSIFLAVGKSAGINVVFDENFRDVPFTTDISGQTFEGPSGASAKRLRIFTASSTNGRSSSSRISPSSASSTRSTASGRSAFPTSWPRTPSPP